MGSSISPRRRRTIKEAKTIIKTARLPYQRQKSALLRIHNAKQPIREAKRIVTQASIDKVTEGTVIYWKGKIDLSDVQELRVKLVRRDHGIWQPHTDFIIRMAKDIIENGMSREEFNRRAAALMDMEQSLSKEFRKAEHQYYLNRSKDDE